MSRNIRKMIDIALYAAIVPMSAFGFIHSMLKNNNEAAVYATSVTVLALILLLKELRS